MGVGVPKGVNKEILLVNKIKIADTHDYMNKPQMHNTKCKDHTLYDSITWNSGKGKTLGIEDSSMVARDKVGDKSWLKQAWGNLRLMKFFCNLMYL